MRAWEAVGANSIGGDAAAESGGFAETVRAHQAMVFSIAYHFLRDRFAAEEVAQDVFLQLHAKIGSLASPEHVIFWLRRTASHRSIDYARRRRVTVALDDAPEPRVDGDGGDPMLRDRLRALIASLPEAPRMVMILRYQEELMPEEIAKVMEMPVRTVKSHLQRSLALLREKIERSMGRNG
jgi:RNA polymerase sigma-70 factor, ECF subfamily